MWFPIYWNDLYDILYQLHNGACIGDVFKEEEFKDANGTSSVLLILIYVTVSLWLMYLYLAKKSVYVCKIFSVFNLNFINARIYMDTNKHALSLFAISVLLHLFSNSRGMSCN